jgi:hypothetical protein
LEVWNVTKRSTNLKKHLDSWEAMLSHVREEAEQRGYLLLGSLIGVAILEIQLIGDPELEERRSQQSVDKSSLC